MDKSPEAFRTISEVAEDLDLPQHVLRFWETRFAHIKPLKRGGGRRYYRPDDVDLLKGIRYYLYGEGYTIKGVQRILKERGVRHVGEIGRAQSENYAPPVATIPRAQGEDGRLGPSDWPEASLAGADFSDELREPLRLPAASFADSAEAAHGDVLEMPRTVAEPVRPPAPRLATPSPAAPARIDADGQRILRTVLADLIACKRMLDEGR